ncbi:Zn-ribbon domain-containing OB-fold protein [Novosphingobium taihuense]|uniref:ChsH2 C-terminal OB-fold domain-containing protein n=1 Tax=Novosphingobium taihuense TaxID=260085 RepID=A0A7W7AFF3_9SPHN|nr:OB-fold domain-containing protein [Novosphingobium taihuense]MBB4615072.1 hypothetical protein [Novosphingobium taihuense]TWH79305.1 hypothetical protein IQ25_04026 [Novosphingobium taihuense]
MTDSIAEVKPDEQFTAFLGEGRFMIQRGVDTGTYVFFPRAVAPVTGENLEWVEASGLGTVYSTTVVRKRPPEPSLNVALIDLAEGPRMMSRVEGIDPADVRIGMAVRARIIEAEDGPLIVFVPASNLDGKDPA